MRSRLTLK
jgi:hypothetical protein